MFMFDMSVLDFIQCRLRNDASDSVMLFVTRLGNGGIAWILLTVAFLLFPEGREIGVSIIFGLVLELICCNLILKPLIARTRPYDKNKSVRLLLAEPCDFSFPSGHTGASFVAVTALYLAKSQFWIPSFVLAVLIAFSRLYLYLHYPTDVLAGAVLGVTLGWTGFILSELLFVVIL